jgi:hypothetical protein
MDDQSHATTISRHKYRVRRVQDEIKSAAWGIVCAAK